MIVIDSSGWLEFFSDGPHADEFAARLRNSTNVLTPTVALYEVYKVAKRDRSEDEAVRAVAMMKKTRIVDLTGGACAYGRGPEPCPQPIHG